jgi:hypothetical protein
LNVVYAIASPHAAKRDRIQQLQQQIEAWQALLEKLGGSEGAIASSNVIASSNYSSRLRLGKRCGQSWEKLTVNERSHNSRHLKS